MIIKNQDSFKEDIQQLKKLLSLRLTEKQRFLIERELRFLHSGEKGEQDSVYYLNFHLGKSKNWAVIHNLRLSFEGQVARYCWDRKKIFGGKAYCFDCQKEFTGTNK